MRFFKVNSELFGNIKVQVANLEDDMWIGLNMLLDINIFVHPDDEDLELEDARWIASIYACKDGSIGEEIESYMYLNVELLKEQND